MPLTQEQYVLEHWKFNADQRLKTFNFFVAFSIFANSAVFAAFDHGVHPVVLVLLGGFVLILAAVFAMVDARCRALLRLSKAGLMDFETGLALQCRLFEMDKARRPLLARFTVAFNLLFGLQALFGAMVIGYAALAWLDGWLHWNAASTWFRPR